MKKSQLKNIIKEAINEQKKKGLDGKACWDGYKLQGTKMKGGKRVDNCIPMEEELEYTRDNTFTYNESWLKDKLGNPVKDVYEFNNDNGHLTIYPDLGNSKYKTRSTQFIRFELKEGEVHFVSAFGYERGYDMLKNVLPELPPMGNSSYAGMMTVMTDEETIPVDINTANKMIDAVKQGLDVEAGAQSDFYGKRGPTSGTIDETDDGKAAPYGSGYKALEEDMSVSELLDMEIIDENITEAKFKGKTVQLNKPTRGDSKKFKVYVNSGKKNADGSIKVKKVNFGHGGTTAKKAGQKTMSIRKSNPKARKAFRARHRCDNPGPKTMARYWSCKKW